MSETDQDGGANRFSRARVCSLVAPNRLVAAQHFLSTHVHLFYPESVGVTGGLGRLSGQLRQIYNIKKNIYKKKKAGHVTGTGRGPADIDEKVRRY